MTGSSRLTLRWPAATAAAAALLAAGAGTTYAVLRPTLHPPAASAEPVAATPHPTGPPHAQGSGAPAGGAQPDVVVTISPAAAQRGGIITAPVVAGTSGSALRLPGVVEANGYKQVGVTPLVAGRITRVFVESGDTVRRGQTMAEIFSPELAEAQTRYISARAELEAHERELQRTEKLVEIGAASRQELERLHAEHTARVAAVESARSRLELLGGSAAAITSLSSGKPGGSVTTVAAPITGVVTERTANPGLNVDQAAKLFTVVDLSTVWVVADVYERDFVRVRVGSPAIVSTKAYPGLLLHGRVSYIDPQLNTQTRTARIRVEVPNARHDLRFGMYADVSIEQAGPPGTTLLPRSAVQNVGDRTVVYLADPAQPGRFTERTVRLGDVSGEQVTVLEGVHAGDTVVTEGSFLVRAERERLGLGPATGAAPGHSGHD